MDRHPTHLLRSDAGRRLIAVVVCACAVSLNVSPSVADSWSWNETSVSSSQDFVTLHEQAGVSLIGSSGRPHAPEVIAFAAVTGLSETAGESARSPSPEPASSPSAAQRQQEEWASFGGRDEVAWKDSPLTGGWAWKAMGATILVIGFALATIYVSAGRVRPFASNAPRSQPTSTIQILAEQPLPYRGKLLLVSAADEMFLVGVDPSGMKSLTSVMALPTEGEGSTDTLPETESGPAASSPRTGLRFPWPPLVTEDERHGGQPSLQRAA